MTTWPRQHICNSSGWLAARVGLRELSIWQRNDRPLSTPIWTTKIGPASTFCNRLEAANASRKPMFCQRNLWARREAAGRFPCGVRWARRVTSRILPREIAAQFRSLAQRVTCSSTVLLAVRSCISIINYFSSNIGGSVFSKSRVAMIWPRPLGPPTNLGESQYRQ